jgi:hypothetical protein
MRSYDDFEKGSNNKIRKKVKCLNKIVDLKKWKEGAKILQTEWWITILAFGLDSVTGQLFTLQIYTTRYISGATVGKM